MKNNLENTQTKTIGVILTDLKSGFDSEIIRGIQDVSEEYKYSIFLANTNNKKNRVQNCINNFITKQVDGIIMVGGQITDTIYASINSAGIPLVTISCETNMNASSKFATVSIDNIQAAYDAVEYMIQSGHTKIAMISGEKNEPNAGIPRITGYKLALENNNIPIRDDYIIEGAYTFFSGFDSASAILSFKDIPTAIFVASDAMALGAMKSILEIGLKIPEDIAIFGFDGLEFTEFCFPSLSTIAQPRYEMGGTAMTTLMKFINNEEIPKTKIILQHEIVQRRSC